jgi:hypothetical protein
VITHGFIPTVFPNTRVVWVRAVKNSGPDLTTVYPFYKTTTEGTIGQDAYETDLKKLYP